ncbi:hypothetical protein BGZ97_008210 [Linnemannia gamsii]|uniref:Uncharacterized protein n=1 Tax=Linnemannia gamsii TaxID=64522 RepID=A0A9P6QNL1_9FUNG|nr:hypothetical protein BGZ97_008210 [Linnemannia gamsii]
MFDRYYELPVFEVKVLAQYHGVVVDRIENTPTLQGVRGSRHVYFTRIRPNVDETFEEDYAEDETFEEDYAEDETFEEDHVEDEVFKEIHVEGGTPENSK